MQNKPRYAVIRARLRNLGLANNEANHVIYSFKQAGLSFGPLQSHELVAESQAARRDDANQERPLISKVL